MATAKQRHKSDDRVSTVSGLESGVNRRKAVGYLSERFKKVNISILGSSEGGDTRLETVGTLSESDGDIIIRYYEKFEGDTAVTKNLLTISGSEVRLEKSGGVKAVLRFEAGAVHEAVYHTGAGPLSMHIISDNVYTRVHSEGADVELRYRLRFAPDSEALNSLKLTARYIDR